jgi:hypothetical protein
MITETASVEQLKDAVENLEIEYARISAAEDEAETRYAELFAKSEKLRKQRKTGDCVKKVQADMSDAWAALKRLRSERVATYNVMKDAQTALGVAENAA